MPRRAAAAAPIVAIIVAELVSRLWFVVHRDFDLDELSTVHAAWNISRGLMVYRDFFEHHTPWGYWMLAPVLRWFPTDTDPASAAHALFACRLVMWLCAIAIVAAIARAGSLWRDRRTGLLAAAFTATSALFLDMTLEIRPDVPALLAFVASTAALLQATRCPRRAALAWTAAAGFALGATTMFLQKYGIVLPFMAVASMLAGPPAEPARRRAIEGAAAFLLGAAVPVVLTLAVFLAADGLGAFLHYNVTFNATLHRARFGPLARLPGIMLRNPTLVFLGLAGAVAAWRSRPHGAADRVVFLVSAGALALFAAVRCPTRSTTCRCSSRSRCFRRACSRRGPRRCSSPRWPSTVRSSCASRSRPRRRSSRRSRSSSRARGQAIPCSTGSPATASSGRTRGSFRT